MKYLKISAVIFSVALAASATAQTNTFPASGNVGIGTTNPFSTLTVRTGTNQNLTFTSGSSYGGSNGVSIFSANDANNAYQQLVLAGLNIILNATGGTGNVGIGTTSPGTKLEVNGSVKLTSGSGASITFSDGTAQSTAWTGTVCGGDYAESVDVTGDRKKYEPGDVLVLDSDSPGKILKSIEAYSTSVSGIYSTKPGTVGRRQTTPKSDAEVPMAVIGIVPAKVSAENGPIKVGDLLVTSSISGHAMKGTDRGRMLGAVVGKAMGTLNSGTGVIEVLVTLQ